MRPIPVLAACLLLAACGDEPATAPAPTTTVPAPAPAQAHGAWHTEFAPAAAAATAGKRPILADFQGSDWCPACKLLHKKVFATPEFTAWAERSVVLLDVDLPNDKSQPAAVRAANEALVQTHGISEFPTVLLLDASGKKLAQVPVDLNNLTPQAFIAAAESVMPAK